LHEALYQNGSKIYQEMAKVAKTAKDDAKEAEYQDKALAQYDLRIKYFGGEADVMNRKGYYLYPYLVNRKGDRDQLLADYKKIVDLNGKDTYNVNIKYYMTLASIQAKAGKLTEDDIMAIHDRLTKLIDDIIKSTNDKKWSEVQEYIDAKFAEVITFDCERVKKFLVPKMKEDIATAKKVFHYMLKDKCTSEPAFLESAILIFNSEPTPGIARIIAQQLEVAGKQDEAINWYEKSIGLETETDKKGESYLDLAKLMRKQGRLSDARSYAFKAAEISNAAAAEAYTMVGDLYFSSYKSCTGDDPVKARAIYMIAYDMYAKAGNGAGMSRCKEQFPSIEDIFTYKYKEGDSVGVGCWVGGSTTIRRR
jgi:tetratricopeptide (TPR) repeat protein